MTLCCTGEKQSVVPIARQASLLGISRRMARETSDILKEPINRKHIQRLMDVMGLEALYPKPHLSWNGTNDYRFPYLLTGVTANHPNHIWGTDITYIRMRQGFFVSCCVSGLVLTVCPVLGALHHA